jgi:hypothetical protein
VQKYKHDQMLGLISQAKQLPPDQYQTAWPQLVQQAAQFEPKIAKSLDPSKPVPQQALDQIGLGLMTQGQYIEQEKQSREAKQAAAALRETSAKATVAEQEAALTPQQRAQLKISGEPAGAEMQDWLKKNPGKGASDFLKWKSSLAPTATFNLQSSLLTPEAKQMAGQAFAQTGQLPAGMRSPAMSAGILNQAAASPGGVPDIAANKATYGADTASLKKLQTTFDQVSAFENTAVKNLDLYISKAQAIPDIGARFANVPLRMITGKMIGEKNYAAMQAARQTAATETAKVLGSANASGVLSDSQKKEAMDVLDGNLPLAATIEVVNTLKQDFKNRHQSYQDQLKDIKGRMSPQSAQPAAAPAAAPQATGKVLPMSAIQQAAKDHNVSVDEAKRQAVAAGYTIQ